MNKRDDAKKDNQENATPQEPWYKDGLCFECTQCGNCCTGDPGVVWVNEDELGAIADYLGSSLSEVRLLHTRRIREQISLTEHSNGDCTFFDPQTRKCRIYPVRPRQCRSWPFWNSNLSAPEAWQQTRKVCPGAGKGNFVSLDVIEKQASLIDI